MLKKVVLSSDLVQHFVTITKTEHASNYVHFWRWVRVFIRIGEAGEYCKVTGRLKWKERKQNLGGEFCVEAGEFSNLPCLMNTLHKWRNHKPRKKRILLRVLPHGKQLVCLSADLRWLQTPTHLLEIIENNVQNDNTYKVM